MATLWNFTRDSDRIGIQVYGVLVDGSIVAKLLYIAMLVTVVYLQQYVAINVT